MVSHFKIQPLSPVFCCTWGLWALENKLPNSCLNEKGATTWLLSMGEVTRASTFQLTPSSTLIPHLCPL